MAESAWLKSASEAFRLMVATSWLAPDGCRERQQAAVRGAVSAGVDWDEYLRLVDRHRTPAISWAALKLAPELEIPQPARQELKKRSDACRMLAVRHSLLLAAVLKCLSPAQIPAMPFKGPALSSELYRDVGLRHARPRSGGRRRESAPGAGLPGRAGLAPDLALVSLDSAPVGELSS